MGCKIIQKIRKQIENFIPRNEDAVRRLSPQFDRIADNYTILLVVGFPDPYDAMVLEHKGRAYMVFDLIQLIYSTMADTGEYWDKFASIAGMLYLLQHIDDIERIYQEGWHDFTTRILLCD